MWVCWTQESQRDIEDELHLFRVMLLLILMTVEKVVARRPPNYALIDFDDTRDPQYVIHELLLRD